MKFKINITPRYYVPLIEEFHKGFEYEVLQKGVKEPDMGWLTLMPVNTEDEWFKFTYPDPYIGYDVTKLFKHAPEIRVKRLDDKDLTDLGWGLTGMQNSPTKGREVIFTTTRIHTEDQIDYLQLNFNPDTNVGVIKHYTGDYHMGVDYIVLYKGVIKNKIAFINLLNLIG